MSRWSAFQSVQDVDIAVALLEIQVSGDPPAAAVVGAPLPLIQPCRGCPGGRPLLASRGRLGPSSGNVPATSSDIRASRFPLDRFAVP